MTNHYVAFNGWPDTKVLISLKEIKSVEKSNALYFLANAITIYVNDGEEYFFGSFLDRDLCHQTISSMVTIEKSLLELTNPEAINNNKSNEKIAKNSSLETVNLSPDQKNIIKVEEKKTEEADKELELVNAVAPDYGALLKKSSDIMVMLEEDIEVSTQDVWMYLWKIDGIR